MMLTLSQVLYQLLWTSMLIGLTIFLVRMVLKSDA